MIFKRNITETLKRALKRSPVVLLTGARQTGKSTLIKEVCGEEYTYVSLDDLRFLAQAKYDPIGFLAGLPKPLILDEVQRVPEIFLAIKQDIDINRVHGRYALTGSANPLLIPQLSDSLAGRMEILQLFPLSQGELNHRHERFIDRVFSTEQFFSAPPLISRVDLLKRIIVGGYPVIQGRDEQDRDAWFESYITTILQRDVKDLANIEGITKLPDLLRLLAARPSGMMNVAELSRTSGIATTTLHRYIVLLETLFLVYLQPAWSANLSKRLVKSPKSYLIDTGLLAFENGLQEQRLLAAGTLLGGILENFVVGELRKQMTWSDLRVRIYHYRTQNNSEVDIVLEDKAGRVVGIEVKASESITPRDSKGLRELQESLGDKFIRGIILYSGSQTIPISEQITALPITTLWQ
jgi:predicted AAA+ superfamily ATPase